MGQAETDRRFEMKGLRAGFGLALGAGVGVVAGLMVTDDAWIWWLLVGAAVGLVIGAVMDSQSRRD